MKQEKNNELCCADVRTRLDAGDITPEVRQHLRLCPDCMLEARILAAAASLDVPPPDGFADGVMRLVRAEKKRNRRRMIVRWGGAVAAALVLIPAALVLAPMLNRFDRHVDATEAAGLSTVFANADVEAETESETTVAETIAVTTADAPSEAKSNVNEAPAMLYSVKSAPAAAPAATSDEPTEAEGIAEAAEVAAESDGGAAPEEMADNGTPPAAAPAAENANSLPAEPAPDYVGERSRLFVVKNENAITTACADVSAAANAMGAEDAAEWRVLRSLVGGEEIDAFLAAYEGSAEGAAVDACVYFAIDRDAFVQSAMECGIELAEERLAQLFPEDGAQ